MTKVESMAGVKTWFVRIGNDMVWRKSREDLLEQYGEDCGPMSFAFIPAKCTDNPVLMQRDKTYLHKLKSLPRVEQARLLHGSWYAKEESSSIFVRSWLNEVDHAQVKPCTRVRAWDLACSQISEINVNPDYTASVLFSKSHDGEYTIEEVTRFRGKHGDVFKQILATAERDGQEVTQIIPKDPGVGGSAHCESIIKLLVSNNLAGKAMPTAGRGGKISRFAPFGAAANAKLINIVKGCCYDYENKILGDNNFYYDELERVDPENTRKGHNDMFDATADAFEAVNKKIHIPNFLHGLKSADLSFNNPFAQ